MGSVPSTPRKRDLPTRDTVESLIAAFVGEKSIPFVSKFWWQLLEIPLDLHWSNDHDFQACDVLGQLSGGHLNFYVCLVLHIFRFGWIGF